MAQIFPSWSNSIPKVLMVLGGLGGTLALLAMWYWFSPRYTDVGYQPEQPIPYSHKLHGGDMGIDCRYCHNTVERAARAAIPPAQTCMNCHAIVRKDSPRLKPLRQAWESGQPIPWVRVHQLPDYVYFDHSVHLAQGVGCTSCHGRIDSMRTVRMDQPLSMSWCLDCHKNPLPHLRPADRLTDMDYDPVAAGYDPAADPQRKRLPDPPTFCSGCHR